MRPNSFNINKLRIINYPNPLLNENSKPIAEITTEIADLADRMIFLMEESCGIGLAAPQVGVPLRLVVISTTGKRQDSQILINPVLSNLQGTCEMEEGCLSLPGVHGNVKRPSTCSVEAQDIDGNSFMLDTVELTARVIQHEVDHLDGKLFTDRLSTIQRLACRRSVRQLEKEYNQ